MGAPGEGSALNYYQESIPDNYSADSMHANRHSSSEQVLQHRPPARILADRGHQRVDQPLPEADLVRGRVKPEQEGYFEPKRVFRLLQHDF
jgi:hypothetical protein